MRAGIGQACGYLGAVLSASFAFTVIGSIRVLSRGGLSLVHPWTTKLSQATAVSLLIFAMMIPLAGLTALVPWWIAQKIAKRFSIQNAFYYAAAGAITGLAVSPLGVTMFGQFDPGTPTFGERIYNISWLLVPSGIVGGLTYWLLNGRFLRRDDVLARR